MTFILWLNKSALSLHEHAMYMYEQYASDYESVGHVYLRGPLQDIDNCLWRYNIDRTTTVMNHGRIVNVSISP